MSIFQSGGSVFKSPGSFLKSQNFGAGHDFGRDYLRHMHDQSMSHQNQQDVQDWQTRNQQYRQELSKLNGLQAGEDTDRNAALAQFDAGSDNPYFDNQANMAYSTDLQNALAGLNEQYAGASQKQGLASAKRGVMGGSNDIEGQSDLASAFQSKAIDATGSALQRRSQLFNQRRASQSSFRKSILAGDPAQAAQYQQMAQNENQQASNSSRMQDFMNAFGQIRGQQADNTSRLYGGGLKSAANDYMQSNSGWEG